MIIYLPLSVKVRKEEWATPNARDCGGHTITKNYPDGFNKNLVTDVAKADNWPTPRAGNPGSRKPGTGGKVLSEEAKNWPTPLEDDASNVNPSDKRMKT